MFTESASYRHFKTAQDEVVKGFYKKWNSAIELVHFHK